jgi:hypothetical protein
MLKAQDPRSKVTVGWHQAAPRQRKAQQLLYAPLHLKCSSREPCTSTDFSDMTGAPTGNYQLENPPQLCSMWQGAKEKHITAVELQHVNFAMLNFSEEINPVFRMCTPIGVQMRKTGFISSEN